MLKDYFEMNLEYVKKVSLDLGTNKEISKKLNIPLATFKQMLYYNYAIKDDKARSFAIRFARAVNEGKFLRREEWLSE